MCCERDCGVPDSDVHHSAQLPAGAAVGAGLCCSGQEACGAAADAPCHDVRGRDEDDAGRRLSRAGVFIEGEERDAHQSCCSGAAVAREVQDADDAAAVS